MQWTPIFYFANFRKSFEIILSLLSNSKNTSTPKGFPEYQFFPEQCEWYFTILLYYNGKTS